MWILITLSCAFLTATYSAISKLILKDSDEYMVAFLNLLASSPFLLAILLWIKIPPLDRRYFLTLAIMLPLEFSAYVLYMKAIKRSPLSLTLPFLALTPVFLIISGKIILHEDINPIGLSGILLIVFGAYALHAGTSRLGIFEPFRAIFKERGSIYMIIVAFIYSITSACGKFAIKQSSPLFFGATYDPLLGFLFIPVVCIRYSRGALNLSLLKSHKWQFLLLAIVFSLSVITHCIGISMANAAYMISIKRLSMVFAVFYGHILFKEKEIANRLIGTSLMFAGAVLIAFA